MLNVSLAGVGQTSPAAAPQAVSSFGLQIGQRVRLSPRGLAVSTQLGRGCLRGAQLGAVVASDNSGPGRYRVQGGRLNSQ